MRETFATLRAAQLSQTASLAARAAEAPGKVAALEPFWERNLTLDGLFYDVKVVDPAEAEAVSRQSDAAEGAILIVPPPGRGALTICRTLEAFLAAGGSGIRALSVAGVGSSALGAAALARNVATATGAPVAAVVSGYGYSDVASEGLGGWFWFGTMNRLRHGFEVLDRTFAPQPRTFAAEAVVKKTAAKTPLSRISLDTWTTLQLLGDPQFDFDLLVGHSKGNLVISEALYALGEADEARLETVAAKARIVTISARIAMPPACRTVIDVMGTADALGELNSTPGIWKTDIKVFGAGHHTNTDLPGHIDVDDVVRQALAM